MAPIHGPDAVAAALNDLAAAEMVEDGAESWFRSVWMTEQRPLAADVWVFSPGYVSILVVDHPWRGLVPPGGRVEPGETQREGAGRELAEETGLVLEVAAAPAFAAVRSYRDDWPPTLNLSYWAVASPATARLVPEVDQPALWVDVKSAWRTYHANDAQVISGFAERKRREQRPL